MPRPRVKSASVSRRRRSIARRSLWVVGIVLVAGALVICDRLGVFGRAPRPDWGKYHGQTFRVVEVIDGDTFDVDIPDGKWDDTRIRLWGVDTPETHDSDNPDAPPMHYGPEATAFTRELVADQPVRLELVRWRTRGMHGRLLAYVFLPDGRMLNRVLVEHGYGYADPRFRHPRKEEFARLQRQAREAGRGLWAELTDRDLPYYYRGRLNLATAPAVE
jgi:micrococcal nuclease